MKPALAPPPRRSGARLPPPLPGVEPRWREGDPVAGTQYRYVRELGCGVQGLAIEVEHAFLGSRAAMKILRAQHVSRRSVAERVRSEARALVELRHSNIVRVTDGGMTAEDEPRPFFVMELLKGDTLRGLLKKSGGSLDVRRALDVGIDILDALDHAHARNMVHRDVKPANIFLVRGGLQERAVLLDFGIASVMEPGAQNRAGFSGTYEYAAPEQLDGYLTGQSDVYALATVLYLCLAGQHPFPGVSGRDALGHAQRHVVPARLANVPRELADLIAQSLEKDPRRRPKSAFALAQKLRDVRKGLRPARPMVVAVAEASRAGSTEQLLRNLATAPTEPRDDTTCELETELAATRVQLRPKRQDSTSILVAPWIPARRQAKPASPRAPRPGRPRPSPSSSHVTASAPQVLAPLSSRTAGALVAAEPASVSWTSLEPSSITGTEPSVLVRLPVQPAPKPVRSSTWRDLVPAQVTPALVVFVLFFFALGAALAVLLV